jgi:ubiquinone/menaquinone biosynthesis C-methylase UbiE
MAFDKVREYYDQFDEWSRLATPEGALVCRITLEVIARHVPPGSRVLDLGGGPGRYMMELARRGYRMSLGDLSPVLVETARVKEEGVPGIEEMDVVNAVDLGIYPPNGRLCRPCACRPEAGYPNHLAS